MRIEQEQVRQVWAEVSDHLCHGKQVLVMVTEWANGEGLDAQVTVEGVTQTMSLTSTQAHALAALIGVADVHSPDDDA